MNLKIVFLVRSLNLQKNMEENFPHIRREVSEVIASAPPSIAHYRMLPPELDRIVGGSRPRNYVSDLPIVSIVTVVRNGEGTLERCIESIKSQQYPNIEYLIADGRSTDGTVEILRRYDRVISHWVSEPDLGSCDAMNKMISQASGEYVSVLLADDWLADDYVEISMKAFDRSGADYVFGDVNLYQGDSFLYRRGGNPDFARTLRYAMSINTPGWTMRRSIFEAIGLFKLVEVSPEYDWMLRAHLAGYKGIYDPEIVYYFRFGGNSTVHAVRGLAEVRQIAISQGVNSLLAWIHFLRNAGRYKLRVALERVLPEKLMLKLRRWRRAYIDQKSKLRSLKQAETLSSLK